MISTLLSFSSTGNRQQWVFSQSVTHIRTPAIQIPESLEFSQKLGGASGISFNTNFTFFLAHQEHSKHNDQRPRPAHTWVAWGKNRGRKPVRGGSWFSPLPPLHLSTRLFILFTSLEKISQCTFEISLTGVLFILSIGKWHMQCSHMVAIWSRRLSQDFN